MKYVCFGYLDVNKWQSTSPDEKDAMMDACFAYDEVLKKNGHWVAGEGLGGEVRTLRYQNDKVSVIDGPFAESKELLGGLLLIEARDFAHATELIANHPGVRMGAWEIRPVQDLAPIIEESERRRSVHK